MTFLAQTNENAPILKVQPNSNWCLGCICEAISNCTRGLQCDGGVCGLFRITWAYWADAGKPTLNNEDPNSQTGKEAVLIINFGIEGVKILPIIA